MNLSGLRWADVDLEGARLHVRRSIKNDLEGGWVEGPPKIHQARRIALDSFTIAVLCQHRARASSWAVEAATEVCPEAYVLSLDPTGKPAMRPDSLGRAFSRLCANEGVKGVTLHSLRHFSASMLIASGRDVRTIARRLGHSDASTTLRVYAHMVDGRDQDAADFLDSLLAAPSQPTPIDKG